jgi:MFS family permease
MQVLGVNWFLLHTTGSATRMGLGIMLQALPALLLGPYAGALADRFRPRPLVVTGQLLHAVLALGLVAVVLADGGAGPVYLISLLSGVVSAFDGPALGRFGSMVAGRDLLGNALALGSLINSTGRIIGMALGGVLVVACGPAALFLGNAASFLAVVAAVLAMRPSGLHPLAAPAAGGADRGVRAGFGYLLRQPVVLVTLALALVLGSVGRNYQVTMAAMSAGPLRGGAAGFGVLSTVFAIGTVGGALLAASRPHLSLRLLVLAGAAASTLQLLAGLAPGLVAFAALLIPIAAAAVVIDTTVSSRVQLDTREDMRGRVLSAMAIVSSLAGMTGAPLLGWLSETIGPRLALVIAGAIGLVACACAGVVYPRLTATRVAAAGPPALPVRREPVGRHVRAGVGGELRSRPVRLPALQLEAG